mgnify:CR=1 FL=1
MFSIEFALLEINVIFFYKGEKLMKMFNKTLVSLTTAAVLLFGASSAYADKLDDVIDAGVLRCGVVLDFPPMGYRAANNVPAGFDVE